MEKNDFAYMAFLAGAAAAVAFLTTPAEAVDRYGAASITEFCRNTGRLDDVRDIVSDLYTRQSGRTGTVSRFC